MFNCHAFARDKGIPILEEGHHHCAAGWLQLNCPFCAGGVEGWHLGFQLEDGFFHCWRCGKHSVWDTVAQLLRTTDKGKIYETLQQYETQKTGRKRQKAVARKKTIALPPGTGELKKIHRKYLIGRGYDPDQLVEEWDLKGTTHLGGAWAWRVIIPIRSKNGDVVAYQGRALKPDQKPRYKMTDEASILVEPKSLLYGIDKVPGDSVLVVEGAPGVWRLGPGTVATLGISWHVEQATELRTFAHRYIMFDPEPVAQRRAFLLATWLSYYPGTTEILDGFQTDPGDFSARKAARIMRSLGFPRK